MTLSFPPSDLSPVIKDALSLKRSDDGDGGAAAPIADSGARQAVKITLAGDGAVGKTSLVYRLCAEKFDARRTMTIGVEFHIYDIKHPHSTKFFLLIVLVAAFTCVVVFFIACGFTRPIVQLTQVADRISMGELDIQIGIDRKDEIGQLAEAIG